MTKEEFIKFVQTQEFLGAERQKDLIDNADWITAKEREDLVKRITQTGEAIASNNLSMIEELNKVEEAVQQFNREELPKLVKAEEASEHESEAKKAEELLQKL
jgi:hypothetical protein